jgi:DDE superfamily endonuclease
VIFYHFKHLEETNFLAPGLCIFGDNAYVNTQSMSTPYKGVSSGSKDNYNFYHSHLTINIECAFGMLVHRWGIFRRAMPCNITVIKTTALTMCLCRLHNFCIDNRESTASVGRYQDIAIIEAEGGLPLVGENMRPNQLLDGGEHFNDVSRNVYCRRVDNILGPTLSREIMLQHVIDSDKCRPKPVNGLQICKMVSYLNL